MFMLRKKTIFLLFVVARRSVSSPAWGVSRGKVVSEFRGQQH